MRKLSEDVLQIFFIIWSKAEAGPGFLLRMGGGRRARIFVKAQSKKIGFMKLFFEWRRMSHNGTRKL